MGTLAALALALALAPQASAHWAYRTSYRWDPHGCRYVASQERYWVPDPCDVRPPHHHHGRYQDVYRYHSDHRHDHDSYRPSRYGPYPYYRR